MLLFQDTDDSPSPPGCVPVPPGQKDGGIRLSGEPGQPGGPGYPGRRTPAAPRGTVDPDGLYCRISPREGRETYALLKTRSAPLPRILGGDDVVWWATQPTPNPAASFTGDNLKISVLHRALLWWSSCCLPSSPLGCPILLVLTIKLHLDQLYLPLPDRAPTCFFMSYLIVSAVQMGATIDYAIVTANRYLQLRDRAWRRAAAVEALRPRASPPCLLPLPWWLLAGFLIGEPAHRHHYLLHRRHLGRGTLTSMVLVMTVLPSSWCWATPLSSAPPLPSTGTRKQQLPERATMRLDGHVRGRVSGSLTASSKGRAPRAAWMPSLRASDGTG